MYLRLGWVVGNAGFGGALLIILLAKLVTTGLSMASMVTNIKIGAGGTYAIISRSMGIEIGGAIGIPLYLSQALGAAMYIVGFTEAWIALFPEHSPFLVSSSVLFLVLVTSLLSAKVAMKVQFLIMFLIVMSLFSFFMGKSDGTAEITAWGPFENAPFWVVFAIFIPAVTGIEAGAAMSGDLRNPKISLKIGILSSIVVSIIIYIAIAFWMDYQIPNESLRSNYLIMADFSKWRLVVMAAILGATLSSALGSIVGGPRTLMALGQNNVIPFGKYFARKSKNGEPRLAIITTGFIVFVSLIFGDLNSIAPLLTMFFLIAYGTINLIVFIEKRIGITSYRPSFDIPLIIPAIGAIWSGAAMFLINPIFAASSIVFIILIFLYQIRVRHKAPWGDVREGLFNALAEWAIKMSDRMPKSPKSWKPNLMVPVGDPERWMERMSIVRDIAYPKGSIRVFHVRVLEKGIKERIKSHVNNLFSKEGSKVEQDYRESAQFEDSLIELTQPLKEMNMLTVTTVIEANDFVEGVSIVTQSLRGMPLPPNVLFLSMSQDEERDKRLESLLSIAIRERMGVILLKKDPDNGFGSRKKINLWLRKGSPNRNLTTLTAIQLEKNWDGVLNLINTVKEDSEVSLAITALEVLAQRGRLPADTEKSVVVGDFFEELEKGAHADIHIFGFSDELDLKLVRRIADMANGSCLFVRDSGTESALA